MPCHLRPLLLPTSAAEAAAVLLVLACAGGTGGFVDDVTVYCYQSLSSAPEGNCCKDVLTAEGVETLSVKRPGTSWTCSPSEAGGACLDKQAGLRGSDTLWWPAGADCTTPRILFVHGGDWQLYGPTGGSYDGLASKLAAESLAVVMVPDYRLAPIGNYSDTMQSLQSAWTWLSGHGATGEDCSAAPRPPLFIAGDSSGAASAFSLLFRLVSSLDPLNPTTSAAAAPAGLLAFTPWTNLACDSPTYTSNAFGRSPDGKDMAGDIRFRSPASMTSDKFRQLALAYASQNVAWLTDPTVSPYYAMEEQLQSLPPLYFAIAGNEVRTADGVVLAQRAAQFDVLVVQDVYESTWHDFVLFSEGCGAGSDFWAAKAALRRAGEFVRQVKGLAEQNVQLRRTPGDDAAGAAGGLRSMQRSRIFFPPPQRWNQQQPQEVEELRLHWVQQPATQPQHPAADVGVAAAACTGAFGAPSAAQQAPCLLPSSAFPSATSPGVNAAAAEAAAVEEACGCDQSTLAGAYLTGAAGGVLCTALALVGTYLYQGRSRIMPGFPKSDEGYKPYSDLAPALQCGLSQVPPEALTGHFCHEPAASPGSRSPGAGSGSSFGGRDPMGNFSPGALASAAAGGGSHGLAAGSRLVSMRRGDYEELPAVSRAGPPTRLPGAASAAAAAPWEVEQAPSQVAGGSSIFSWLSQAWSGGGSSTSAVQTYAVVSGPTDTWTARPGSPQHYSGAAETQLSLAERGGSSAAMGTRSPSQNDGRGPPAAEALFSLAEHRGGGIQGGVSPKAGFGWV